MLAGEGEEGGKWGKMLRSDEGENWAKRREGRRRAIEKVGVVER